MSDTAFRTLLQTWLDKPDDWKDTILSLQDVELDVPISPNAKYGFQFLRSSVFGTMCRTCDDWTAWAWMNAYAAAYLKGAQLPVFDERCWKENCTKVD